MDDTTYVFISPHLDDAVLSCGGLIHQLAARGRQVKIVTVATADDGSELPPSWLAQRNLRSWGGQKNIFAVRRSEDVHAARRLGAEVVHLGFLDCMYRRDTRQMPLYSKSVTDVQVDPFDWESFTSLLESALGTLFNQLLPRELRVFCPLALGNHVDHVLVRRVVEALIPAQQRIYYEDFPYAMGVRHPNGEACGLSPFTVPLSSADVKARVEACACYTSQLPGLFPTTFERVSEVVRARVPVVGELIPSYSSPSVSIQKMEALSQMHILRVGGERYWALDPVTMEQEAGVSA